MLSLAGPLTIVLQGRAILGLVSMSPPPSLVCPQLAGRGGLACARLCGHALVLRNIRYTTSIMMSARERTYC